MRSREVPHIGACVRRPRKQAFPRSPWHDISLCLAYSAHRAKSFKLSSDPYFIEKVRDIVGLYLSPPTNALVLCVDEKSQCQALERTQPVLLMGLSYIEGVTHDYIRHDTTTLFAALNAATGEIIAQCKPKHRHLEFISFLTTSIRPCRHGWMCT